MNYARRGVKRRLSTEIREACENLERRRPDVSARKRHADKIRAKAKEREIVTVIRTREPKVSPPARKPKKQKKRSKKRSQDIMDRGKRLPGSYETGKRR
jgi:hypothetical protein